MHLIFSYLILFFYDVNPITINGFVMKNDKQTDYCPFYFSTEIENSTTCNLEWYRLNDTFKGHKIQCIGRSPYSVECTYYSNKIDKCYLINNCLPQNFTKLCEGIEII